MRTFLAHGVWCATDGDTFATAPTEAEAMTLFLLCSTDATSRGVA